MSSAIKITGSIVLSLLLYSIPVLNTCAFIYNWYGSIQFLLAATSFAETFFLASLIYWIAEYDE